MPTAFTSTPREARWLKSRLEAPIIGLPVKRYAGGGSARHIVYRRQGGTDLHVLGGNTYDVRSAWLIYISQPVTSESANYEDLEFDADKMHQVLMDAQGVSVVGGRLVQVARRDMEHELLFYRDTTLVEVQLGGVYVLLTSLA